MSNFVKAFPRVVVACILLLAGTAALAANSPEGFWSVVDERTLGTQTGRTIIPKVYETVALNRAQLLLTVAQAPMEFTAQAELTSVTITLPTPDGDFHRYRIVESPIMAPALAALFPLTKTYSGQGIDDPTASLRFDITPHGFHAIVLSGSGTFYIDPYTPDDLVNHIVYWKRDHYRVTEWECLFESAQSSRSISPTSLSTAPNLSNGTTLKKYRLALAATGEYTQFHGGTKARAIERGMVPTMNRVNAVYGRELSVRLEMVNNLLIIFEDPTLDPYENNNPTALLAQNVVVCDALVGPAFFDIGHVFSTGGGGVALLGSVCGPTKAGGVTGTRNPIGDPFDIDYVAHEMGHQFGGNHTFNGSVSNCAGGNRNADTAFEVGSGSTIQAYAGICPPQNLQPNSDAYFHWGSLEEMSVFITTGGGNGCPLTEPITNNIPTVDGGPDFTIPALTPFTLTASGTDADGDALTYCWEEIDLGPTGDGKTDNGSSPIFRSFMPNVSPSRTFPKISDIVNRTTTYGEILPSVDRTLKFKVTVRDNRPTGAFNDDQVDLTVHAAAGPFAVTSPNTNVLWAKESVQEVTWNVAKTDEAPISTSAVHIYLSTDGGLTFPTILASSTPNDGSEMVTLPGVTTNTARIKIAAAGNIYFDISDNDFTIGATGANVSADAAAIVAESCLPANQAIDDGETVTVALTLENKGLATTNLVATLVNSGGVLGADGPKTYGVIQPNSTATREFTFTSDVACGGILTATFELTDNGIPLGTVSVTFVSGLHSSTSRTLRNINPMIWPAEQVTGMAPGFGPASLYPSPIPVTGFTAPVTKVTALLRGLDHTFAEDLDIMLVGPKGQAVMLMSDVGGRNRTGELTLTFDDDGPALTTAPITSGTYRPTNIGETDNMPPPAPANATATTLAAFNGVDPNGTWNLYASDDFPMNGGMIYGGWALTIMSRTFNCCDAQPIPPAGMVRFNKPTYSVVESAGRVDLTVERIFGSTGSMTVSYTTADGTATAPDDYTTTTGTVTFADGETSKVFSVNITNDATQEAAEVFTVTLSNPTAGVLGAPSVTTVAITDDDEPCVGQPTGSFTDDFEPTPNPGWTVSTADNPGAPAVAPWQHVTDPTANSPTHSYFTQANPGDGGKDDRLVSPPLAISSTSQLKFWHSYNMEDAYDGGFLEVSTDGVNWTKITTFVSGGYTGDSAGGDSWTGVSEEYPFMNEVVADLGAYAGNAVRVRWRMLQDSLFGNVGWFIDDVQFTNLSVAGTPPVANDDTATTPRGTPVTIAVLSNDTDPDGGALTVHGATPGANGGTTVVNADNTIRYTPAPGFAGTDTFAYTVRNASNCGDIGTVTVNVTGTPNNAPNAVDDSASTMQNQPVTVSVLANDTDSDNDTLAVTATTNGTNGTVTNNGTTVTYTPNTGFTGTDSFTYTINDGQGGSDTATVTVTVTAAATSTITSISPSTVCPGSNTFQLRVEGTGFADNSVVTLDGQALPTTKSSSSVLLATVAASHVSSPRNAQIAVSHPTTPSANSMTLSVADAAAPVVTAPAPITILQTVCSADGSGGANGQTSSTLATYLGAGSATDSCTAAPTRLSPQVNGTDATSSTFFPAGATSVTFRFRDNGGNTGTATSTVTVRLLGDLNLDNIVDSVDLVIMANYLVDNTTPGDGTFTAGLESADLDRDGKVDSVDHVILANYLVDNIDCLSD